MEMNGEHRIAAPRAQVWAALNDPEVLKSAIPGCEELVMASPTEMTAKVRAKVGPVSARFAGKVTLSEIDAPNGYRITGEGSGGVAGFAKGGAKVSLNDDGDGTLMRYEVSAQVGGKLAQIGSRLIDGTAKQMANEFFTKFSKAAEAYTAPTDAAPAPTAEASPASPPVAIEAPAATPAAEPVPSPATSEVRDGETVPTPAAPASAAPAATAAVPAPAPVPPPTVDPQLSEAPDGAAVPNPAANAAPEPAATAAPAAASTRPASDHVPPPPPAKPSAGVSPLVWVTGIIIVAGVILYFTAL